MDVLIKGVGKADVHMLEHVADDVFDHDIAMERLLGYLDEPNNLLCVAVSDELVVGQMRAVIHQHPDRPAELYIDNAGVAPAFQRKNVATKLFAEIVRLGKERGCEDAWVGTEMDNKAAHAFYRSRGMEMQKMAMFFGKL